MKKTHNRKRIIMLIVYILLIGLCVLVAIKGCTTNITYALDATNWEQLNNVPVRCVIEGPIDDSDLSNNTWSYISNGNSETGPAQATPAFYITSTFDGEQYDAIYIKTRDIQLRRFIYDEVSGDMVDYYSRTIWQDDWIYEQIEPDTIIFENLNNTAMASNAVKYSLAGLGGQEQTGANHNAINSIMLGIINEVFTITASSENIIYDDIFSFSGLQTPLKVYTTISAQYSTNSLIGYNINILTQKGAPLVDYATINDTVFLNISFSNIENYAPDIQIKKYCQPSPTIFIYEIYYKELDGTQRLKTYNIDSGWFSSIIITDEIDNNAIIYSNSYNNYIANNNYNSGYLHGYNTGYNLGNTEGYDNGYNAGYDDGASGEINTTWVLSLMNTATSILNIEILPNIRIIYLVGAFIVLAFVKFVIGWLR